MDRIMLKPDHKISHTIIGKEQNGHDALMEHAVIGISPFNSYFVEETITRLIAWSLNNFKGISIFIPDGMSIYTLMAQGYSEKDALQKTRRQDLYLKNKVVRSLKNNKIPESEFSDKILTSSSLLHNPSYKEVYESCINKFNNDPPFRDLCLSTSNFITPNKNLSKDDMNIAVKYFLHELPLFLNTPKILGVCSSFFVYHKLPTFIMDLYADQTLSAPNQGFLVAKMDE